MEVTVLPKNAMLVGFAEWSFQMQIQHNATVAEIRAEIINRLEIPVADRAMATLEYESCDSNVGINAGCRLRVNRPSIRVVPLFGYGKPVIVSNIASTSLNEIKTNDLMECRILDEERVLIFGKTIIKEEHLPWILTDYGLKDGDTIYIVKKKWELEMKDCHPKRAWSVNVEVTPMTTMKEIKKKVQDSADVVIHFPLSHYGKLLPDNLTILDCETPYAKNNLVFTYNYSGNVILELYVKTLMGKTLVFRNLTDAASVSNLKTCIQDREGIPPDQQKLIFAAQVMEDDDQLWDYNVMSGSVLHVVLRLRGCACGCLEYDRRNPEDITTLYGNIKVVLPDGKVVTVEVEPVKNSIRDLKKMVHDVAPKFSVNSIELMFCGKLLEEGTTLQQACIRNRSELKLVQLLGPTVGLKCIVAAPFPAIYDIYGQDMLKMIPTEQF